MYQQLCNQYNYCQANNNLTLTPPLVQTTLHFRNLTRMMKILFAVLCLAPALCFAQRIAINGKEGYRKLSLSDFKGAPDTSSTLPAITHCEINWEVDIRRAKQNKDAFPPLKVLVNFTGQSWVNPKRGVTQTALRHEQGHFDIAVLCAAELQQKYNEATFTRFDTAVPVITAMYLETLEKCDRMRTKYAMATTNGKNLTMQTEWETSLEEQLNRYLQPPAGN